ncbi:MAG: glycosyltransferase family 39 protein [Chloroflexi bacterium]|nr:glycosyltransferase family 39 protein [Chloroflexota bacterium]
MAAPVSAAADGARVGRAPERPSMLPVGRLAEAALLAGVLALAVAVRLPGLADPTDLSDEGIRGVQLRLLAAGFKPVSEIYASQGPLSLWLFYPLTALLGPDIVVGRLTAVLASLLALGASAVLARSLAGPLAGIATGLVLAVSPVFLENSRLAFVEQPSLAPTALGLALLVRYRQAGGRGWLIGSVVLLAVGTLAKPMAAVAGFGALVLILAPPAASAGERARSWPARLTDLGIYTTVGLAVCALAIVAIGPQVVYEQVVAYRVGARAARGWDMLANGQIVAQELQRDSLGVWLAALLGGVVTLVRRPPLGIAVLAWTVGAAGALLVYSPLWPKHVTYLLPPLAILAGTGFAEVARLGFGSRAPVQLAAGGVAGVAALIVLAQAPGLAAETRSIVYRHAGSDMRRYADDLAIVQAAAGPDQFVVVDDAYLAMVTGRLVPPPLADLSISRIGARALSADQAIADTRRFDARVLVLTDDHLGGVQRYLTWADREYVLVKGYVQRRPNRYRRVYVAPGVDLTAARAAMLGSLAQQTDVTLGPALLLGYDLESRTIKTGSRVDLTLMLEATQDRAPEHALITRLRDASGDTAWEGQWKIGEGSQELHTWKSGQWQVQTMRLLVDDVPPGEYTLTIGLPRPNAGPARVTARAGAEALPSREELSLGDVTVLR